MAAARWSRRRKFSPLMPPATSGPCSCGAGRARHLVYVEETVINAAHIRNRVAVIFGQTDGHGFMTIQCAEIDEGVRMPQGMEPRLQACVRGGRNRRGRTAHGE